MILVLSFAVISVVEVIFTCNIQMVEILWDGLLSLSAQLWSHGFRLAARNQPCRSIGSIEISKWYRSAPPQPPRKHVVKYDCGFGDCVNAAGEGGQSLHF